MDPRRRPSDADRDHAERALRDAYAHGRFGADEHEARLEQVHRARSVAEIAWAVRGVPRHRPPGRRGVVARVHRAILGAHAAAFVGGNGAAVGVWALTGEGWFWPALILVPWSALFGAHAATGPVVRRALGRGRRR